MDRQFKRLIGVLITRGDRTVKAYTWFEFRPSVALGPALRTLDRWGLDEIVVLDVSGGSRPSISAIQAIQREEIRTPLAYGGGVLTIEDAQMVIASGCERLVLGGSLFQRSRRQLISELHESVGMQAIIASVPISLVDDLPWFHPARELKPECSLGDYLANVRVAAGVSEFLIASRSTEGHYGRFPKKLAALPMDLPPYSTIWFGGLSIEIAARLLDLECTVGVAFGNPLHEKELQGLNIRHAISRLQSENNQVLREVNPLP